MSPKAEQYSMPYTVIKQTCANFSFGLERIRMSATLITPILGIGGVNLPSLSSTIPHINADINAIDARGLTGLAWAATSNDVTSVELLLSHGANPNIADIRGVTPLQVTTSGSCMQRLIEYGANIHAKDNLEQTALFSCYHAAPSDALRCIDLLLGSGADIDHAVHDGFTFLHFCVQSDRPDLVQALLARGANYMIVSKDRSSIVHSALRWADAGMFEVLSRNKLRGLSLEHRDAFGSTGAMLADKR
ncbi:MAG: hypothetical protein M1820_006540 [Bogoriella megaspora]|nr:MAG: hypothetical protein M1820_006540 [Bogoriella megaspora]